MPLNEPIRVTHLLHTVAYGGIETVIINWLTHFDSSAVDANLVIFANPDNSQEPFRQAAEQRGLKVETIYWSSGRPVLRAARELRAIMERHQTQVLHCHNTYADIVGLLAGRKHGAKLVSTIYVWEDGGFGFKRKLLQQADAYALRRFDLLTAQCEKTLQDSADWGFDPSMVRLQPSGFKTHLAQLTPQERLQFRKERQAEPHNIVVCNVARFHSEKAQDLALRCWAEIIKECPHAVLWLYGVGPLEDELRALTSELDLEDHVRFMGFAKNLNLELELCDIQFHPSHNEGIPLAICSGMAAGLPIVAARVGGIPEVIQNDVNGLLVEDNDEHGFVRALLRLIKDPDVRNRLGEEAKRFIQEDYASLEAAAQHLEESYRLTLG